MSARPFMQLDHILLSRASVDPGPPLAADLFKNAVQRKARPNEYQAPRCALILVFFTLV